LTVPEQSRRIEVVRLGRSEYRACWKLQRCLQERRAAGDISDVLLLTEHDPVITLGTTANANHLLASAGQLSSEGIDVVSIDRGGDVTYHGPGQLVGYPIFDLTQQRPDLHWYLRQLEDLVIGALAAYAVYASRVEGYTGVWVGEEKICAIGINVRRWVTMHGFALNVNTDLSSFRHIIPCGIFERGVTSLAALLGQRVVMRDVESALLGICERIFHRTVHETTCRELGIDSESLQRPVAECI
jgi:lipoyl(octanoyl) transferase